MRLSKAVRQALGFIEQAEKGGHFPSYASSMGQPFSESVLHPSPFLTYLILGLIGEHLSPALKSRALRYCIQEERQGGSYNYWARSANPDIIRPYPDDMDDTACALLARQTLGESLSGEVIGKATRLLTLVEESVGGPYRTWVVPVSAKKVWRDVDPIVNANIASFLKGQRVTLLKLGEYLEKCLEKNTLSPYYCGEEAVLFFIGRTVVSARLRKRAEKLAKETMTPQKAALLLGVLVVYPESIRTQEYLAGYLRKTQQDTGGWPPEAFVVESSEWIAGSAALTTALCAYALMHFERQKPGRGAKGSPLLKKEGCMLAAIEQQAHKIITTWPRLFRNQATLLAKAFFAAKHGQSILLTPYYFRESLKHTTVADEIVIQLGVGMLWGWMAYTILDDHYDGEGETQKLPLAALLSRTLAEAYASVLPGTGLSEYFQRVMASLDAATLWEMQEARLASSESILSVSLPNWNRGSAFTDRSFGHAIGPIGILVAAGEPLTGPSVHALEKYFRSYLAARQLTDDMHDWTKDLERGILTLVNVTVIKKVRDLGESTDLATLKRVFWEACAPSLAKRILKEVQTARQALKEVSAIDVSAALTKDLGRLEAAARQSLEERQRVLGFIKVVSAGN